MIGLILNDGRGWQVDKYYVNWKKNTVMLAVFLIVEMLLLYIVHLLAISIASQVALYIIIGISILFFSYRMIREYISYVSIGQKGLKYHRQGIDININWSDVRRLEYKGSRLFPLSDTMIIHLSNGQSLYIDYNLNDYKNIWKRIIIICSDFSKDIIIDNNFKCLAL